MNPTDVIYTWVNSSLLGVSLFYLGASILFSLSCYFSVKNQMWQISFSTISAVIAYILIQGTINIQGPTGDSLVDGLAFLVPVPIVFIIIIFPYSKLNPWREKDKEEKK